MNILRLIYRYKRKSNLIIICLTSMVLFFSIIIGNIESISRSILETNNNLSQNCIIMSFNSNYQNDAIINSINKIKQNDNIIIKYFLQSGFDYDGYSEGIFFNGKYNNAYNLLKGRFFNKDDFNTNAKIAVIGKDIAKDAIVENNKMYILRGTDKYQVIGVIGKGDISSTYDDLILYNLNSILNNENFLDTNTWYLDSVNRSQKNLEGLVKGINAQPSRILFNNPNPLQQAIKSSKDLIYSFAAIIVSIFLALIISISYWIEGISVEIGIRKISGARKKDIFIEIIKRYSLCALFSVILSIILQEILLKTKLLGLVDYEIKGVNLFLSIAFIAVLGIIFIALSIHEINKIELSELLKES